MTTATTATTGALRVDLEALLVVLDRPLEVAEVAQVWGVEPADVRASLLELQESYAQAGRGIRVRETASGWQLGAAEEALDRVRAVVRREAAQRLSPAALETLAVVAYQQPVTRTRVAAVRGVNVDAVVRTLTVRGLVEPAEHDPSTGAVLYRTTPRFLDALGLRTLDELPELPPLLPDVQAVGAEHASTST